MKLQGRDGDVLRGLTQCEITLGHGWDFKGALSEE